MAEWRFKVRPARNSDKPEFIAWCAQTENLGNGPLDPVLFFVHPVHFEFGITPEEALKKLKAEVLN